MYTKRVYWNTCTGTPLPFSHLLKIDSTVKKPPEGFTNYRLFNIVLLSIITSALYNMYFDMDPVYYCT